MREGRCRIQQYRLDLVGSQSFVIPSGSQVLHVGIQDGSLWLACVVKEFSSLCVGSVFCLRTGQICDHVYDKVLYGTVFADNSTWHVFGDIPKRK
jgi:hypothetical protein